ncbi:MAG: flagellar hook-length control protein FliK, partial [Gammaproteobacteria bacterium]
MEIPDIKISSRLTFEPSVTSVLKNLQPGQLLHANVLSDTNQNLVKLKIGTAELIARTQVSLRADQRITLDVIKAGVIPELRIIREPVIREYQADVLRTILPTQIPLQRLYANLQAVYSNIIRNLPQPGADLKIPQPLTPLPPQLNPTLGATAATGVDKQMLQVMQSLTDSGALPSMANQFGPKLVQSVTNILSAAIPNPGNITPAQLRQAILGYGLFLEAQLAAGQPPTASLKSDLLPLLFQIGNILKLDNNQTLPQLDTKGGSPNNSHMDSAVVKLLEILFRHAEGGLARVHLNQLSSLPPDDGSRQVWQFEIPIRYHDQVDSFLIRLEQEQANSTGGDSKPIWYVTLSFNLDPLGPVKAKISGRDDEVSTLFLAERPESAELLNRRMSELGQAFSDSGLSVGKLFARRGNAKPEP